MADENQKLDVAWTFKAPVEVEHVAASANAGWALVADRSRNVHVLNETGSSRGAFRAGQPVRRVRADPDGVVFSALAGDTIIYAFNRQGELEWRVELGGPVEDFDLDPSAHRLAAVSTAGWLYLYSPESRERRVAPVGWPMNSVALVSGEPLRIAACNEKGHVGLLNLEGKVEWQKDLGCRAGGICASGGAGLIVVAGHDAGAILLRLDGQEVDRIRLSAPVLRAAMSPNGAVIMAQTAQDRLVLVRPDASVQWQGALSGPPADWALGAAGGTAVVALGSRDVKAYRTGQGARPRPVAAAAKEETTAAARGQPQRQPVPPEEQAAEMEEIEWPDFFEIETATGKEPPKAGAPPAERAARSQPLKSSAAPKPEPEAAPVDALNTAGPAQTRPGHRVAWKVKLPSGSLPVEESLFRLSEDGAFVLMVTAGGTASVLSADGRQVIRTPVESAAHISPQRLGRFGAVWTASELLILEPAAGSVEAVSLGNTPVRYLDCPDDLGFFCTLDFDGNLIAHGRDGVPLWQKESKGPPLGLLVSPKGETILVADAEGRFRYYERDGSLARKFRFADKEEHHALALSDDLSVFASTEGRVTVLNAEGREVWSRRLFPRVLGLELLGAALAVYGEHGACAAVDAATDAVWDFQPPPGRVRVCKPAGADPIVVHAAGSAVTVFRGYRRKLDVIWHHDCGADITALDADADARSVVALAGEKVYRIECTGPA